MRATVMTFAVASLIVVTSSGAIAQDSVTSVAVATQAAPAAVGSDTIRFGGRIIEAGDTVNGPVVVAAGDLRVRGVIRGTAVAIAGDIIVENGGTITGDAIAVLGGRCHAEQGVDCRHLTHVPGCVPLARRSRAGAARRAAAPVMRWACR